MLKKLTDEQIKNLFEIGISEFASLGYEKANINVIAKKADISVGVVYKYYENKMNFFILCVRHALESLGDVLTYKIQENDTLEDSIHELVKKAVYYAANHKDAIILYHRITNFEDTEFSKTLAIEIEKETSKMYKNSISKFQKMGLVRTDISPGYLSLILDNMLMMLHFTCSCSYYRERYKIYFDEDIEGNEELLIDNISRFLIKSFSA